ncbi:transcriptional regulator [Deinococcus irradiatisoli]|uniref:Transcriptional regulator n=1 Tax=Deinococcus irradiatisoli TaxID=2202254 RepID=A0A2Z3JEW0_9DEIO|nr:helix-turn-helix transcriptional regulator [Deinococcus irradiatisoli]AWN21930.1 transcriptional regulator [Deinococcus irradiatisoli]
MDTPPTAFQRAGRTISERRRLLGLSLEALAAEVGLSAELLRALERGEYDPRSLHLKAARALTRALDLSPGFLNLS